MTLILPHKFEPRDYQINILSALDSGVKRAVWVCHRRAGKDLTVINWLIKYLAQNSCNCYYIMPSYAQAKKVIWDAKNNEGMKFQEYFPDEIVKSRHQQEMKIEFTNGAIFQLVGSENVDSIMGTNPRIVVFSEAALQSPTAWDFIRPIIRANGGIAIFISTPRGKNWFHDLTVVAKREPDWFYELLTIEDTNVLTTEDMEKERREGMSEELIQQEYYCSFSRGVDGTYYGRIIEKAHQEDRIGRVNYESRGVVHTAWDIGFGDSTSIVFWQEIGSEVRIIDFYENQGESIAHYIKYLQSKSYIYGTHYFPHDASSGSIQTGTNLQRVAADLGLKTIVLPRDDVQLGIEAVRSLLSMCFIDEKKCSHLLKCLENYCKKYNDKANVYSETPVHNWASHAADAFRYCAMARNIYGKGVGGLSPIKIQEMRQKHLGY